MIFLVSRDAFDGSVCCLQRKIIFSSCSCYDHLIFNRVLKELSVEEEVEDVTLSEKAQVES